jgi:CTP:molybdopterin cytidylyltransferase MocA
VAAAGGNRGHPTILSARYFDEILNGHDGVGLRGLLLAHPDEVHEIEVDDSAMLADIDLPADYARAVQALNRDQRPS